ncbi:MAG: hypothetical protein VX874_15760 [Pseudomonadota bacterium]|nr:hypothetical protein [Pseudomonadota bacterium]
MKRFVSVWAFTSLLSVAFAISARAEPEMSPRALSGVGDVLADTTCEEINVIFQTDTPEMQEQIIVALIYGISVQRAGVYGGLADELFANLMTVFTYCMEHPDKLVAPTLLGLTQD